MIQSKQENIENNIQLLSKQKEKEINCHHDFMVNIYDQYIQFIQEKNKEKLASSKNFFIIIMSNKFPENQKENAELELKEKYFKLKDSLMRCGNRVEEIKNKEEVKKIIQTFLHQEGSDFF